MRNKNEKAMEDAAIRLVANSYVDKEGEKIIKEAKKLNQADKISPEEMAEFESFCGKEFAKEEWKKRLNNISKVAVAVIAIFVFVSGIYQFNLTYNSVVNENGITTIDESSENYTGDKEYAPTYIPEGYVEKVINFINENEIKFNYYAEAENYLTFYYKASDKNQSNENSDNENFKIVDINGVKAKVTRSPNETIIKISWEKGNHLFCIEAQGVDEEEVIKVARSVKSVK